MVAEWGPLHGHLISFHMKKGLERHNQIIKLLFCPPRKPSWSSELGPGRLARGSKGIPAQQTLSSSDFKLAKF